MAGRAASSKALAPAQHSAWNSRALGLGSPSGRHASPLTPLQMAATSGGRRGALPARSTVGYEGRRAATSRQAAASARPYGMSPGSLMNRPPSVPPPQLQHLQRSAAAVPPPQPLQQQQHNMQAPQPAHAQQQQQQPNIASAPATPSEMELLRRQKISAANKGRTPWNKGRKHRPETIARIAAATKKAMQRPDVKERLAKANEKREPHTDEAKEKIRAKLLERAEKAREEIDGQAIEILKIMRSSEDPTLRACSEYERAHEVVMGLAWQYFKKEWSEVATRGWNDHPEFRNRIISKIKRLMEKNKTKAVPKKKRVSKVKMALGHMKKVQEARSKLAAAEAAMAKLQRAKAAFAADPVRLRQAVAADEKASAMISKLRQQVVQLEEALQPLQQYLDAEQEAEASAQQQQELVERLQEEQQHQQQRVEHQQQEQAGARGAAAAASQAGHADGVALPQPNGVVNGFAGANGVAPSARLQEQLHGVAPDAVNGHAAGVPPGPIPSRRAMPWQQ